MSYTLTTMRPSLVKIAAGGPGMHKVVIGVIPKKGRDGDDRTRLTCFVSRIVHLQGIGMLYVYRVTCT